MKYARPAAVGLALMAALACAPPGTAAAAATGTPSRAGPALPLSHAGRWITDAKGRVVVFHGTNMVYKLAPFYPAAAGFGSSDAVFLERLGLNAVRVGVIWQALEPRPGVFEAGYLNHIASTVNTLARHGIVSILDFHQDQYNQVFAGEGFPSWSIQIDGLPNPMTAFPSGYEVNPALQRAFENFWADRLGPGGVGLQERYAAAWKVVAKRFRDDKSVLGYEIMNEPFPGSDYATCASPPGCPTSDAQLTSLERKVDHAIRSVDKRTLVFQEPYVTFNFGFADHVGPLHDRQAVFAWHDYCLTGTSPCSSNPKTMQNAAAYVNATHEGSFMTEYGATTSTKGNDYMVALADQYMVPWTEWAYCTCGDPTGSPDEGMVLDPRKPPVKGNLRPGIIHALVEPYPQVVSGTPLSWGFVRSKKIFHFKFTTRKASGRGRFPGNSMTWIAVPKLVFPHGYTVRIEGGRIASESALGMLGIASCAGGSPTIRVTIETKRRDLSSCPAPLPPPKRPTRRPHSFTG
jgi:endoglycosylceramidase